MSEHLPVSVPSAAGTSVPPLPPGNASEPATAQNEPTTSALPQRKTTTRGRPRGRSRGSGSRGGRRSNRGSGTSRAGVSRIQTRQNDKVDPSDGWTICTSSMTRLELEKTFTESVLGERARMFAKSVVERVVVQRRARDVPEGKVGFIIMLVDPILRQCMECTNESIKQGSSSRGELHLYDMYRFLSIFLMSHCSGFSLRKSVDIMSTLGHSDLQTEEVRFISTQILAYSPIGRGNMGLTTCNSLRDQTKQLVELERLSFSVVRKVFFGTCNPITTLDDDLFGTRAFDNQVKTLSNRKADKEGNTADVLADALFRVVIGMRFRRRGDNIESAVKEFMACVMEGSGEQAINGLIVTADRGYGKQSVISTLSDVGASSMMVLPEHLLRCHPFVGKSYLNVDREDNIEEFNASGVGVGNGQSASDNQQQQQQRQQQRQQQQQQQHQHQQQQQQQLELQQQQQHSVQKENINGQDFNVVHGRKRAFVIDDDSDLAPAVFHASKRIRRGGNLMHAVAVREHGTGKYAKIIRFFFDLPDSMSSILDTWTAVPRPNTYSDHLFYYSIKSNPGNFIHVQNNRHNNTGRNDELKSNATLDLNEEWQNFINFLERIFMLHC